MSTPARTITDIAEEHREAAAEELGADTCATGAGHAYDIRHGARRRMIALEAELCSLGHPELARLLRAERTALSAADSAIVSGAGQAGRLQRLGAAMAAIQQAQAYLADQTG